MSVHRGYHEKKLAEAHARAKAAEARILELEAQAAAMREALGAFYRWSNGTFMKCCDRYSGYVPAKVIKATTAALAPDAGRELLAELAALREALERVHMDGQCAECATDPCHIARALKK